MSLRILFTSPANGSGKTTLLVHLLNRFPGRFSAAKFITIEPEGSGFCPVHETGCACRRLQGNWGLVTDPEILSQPETDTGRMVAAGARETFWGIAQPGWHEELWNNFETAHLSSLGDLLVEGGRIEEYLAPDRTIFVLDPSIPRSRWKTKTERRMEQADLVVVNHRSGEKSENEELVSLAQERCGERFIEANLAESFPERLVDRLAL